MSKIRLFKNIYNFKISVFTVFIGITVTAQVFSQQIIFNSKTNLNKTRNESVLFFQTSIPQIYCEEALVRMADVVDKANEEDGAYLIIILHLASGEQLNLFEKRRKVLDTYLKNHFSKENQKYIIAQSNRVKGNGQVNFYVGGKLFEKFIIKRNNPGVCMAE